MSGGGGGLQHPAVSEAAQAFPDKYVSTEDLCPFHYVEVFPGTILKVVMRRLDQEQNKVEDGYSAQVGDRLQNLVEGRDVIK